MAARDINRRRLLVGLAAASTAAATVTVATAATQHGKVSRTSQRAAEASPKLLALAAAYKAAWAEFEAAGDAHTAVEQAVINARPVRPEPTPWSADLTERFRGMAIRDIGDETHPIIIEQRAISAKDTAARAAYDAEVKVIEKRLGWKKVDANYLRLMHRACRAADRVLYFPAVSLADIAVKAQVHRTYQFYGDEALSVFARDIERVARKAAQS